MQRVTADERGDGLLLTYVWADEDAHYGEVVAAVSFEGFAGRASAYFEHDDLRGFARELRRYPFGQARAVLTSGYEQPVEEHVGLTVQSRGRRGQLGVTVRLNTPSDDRSDLSWSSRTVVVEVLTTYEALGRFASEVEHLQDGPGAEAWLAAEVMA